MRTTDRSERVRARARRSSGLVLGHWPSAPRRACCSASSAACIHVRAARDSGRRWCPQRGGDLHDEPSRRQCQRADDDDERQRRVAVACCRSDAGATALHLSHARAALESPVILRIRSSGRRDRPAPGCRGELAAAAALFDPRRSHAPLLIGVVTGERYERASSDKLAGASQRLQIARAADAFGRGRLRASTSATGRCRGGQHLLGGTTDDSIRPPRESPGRSRADEHHHERRGAEAGSARVCCLRSYPPTGALSSLGTRRRCL